MAPGEHPVRDRRVRRDRPADNNRSTALGKWAHISLIKLKKHIVDIKNINTQIMVIKIIWIYLSCGAPSLSWLRRSRVCSFHNTFQATHRVASFCVIGSGLPTRYAHSEMGTFYSNDR